MTFLGPPWVFFTICDQKKLFLPWSSYSIVFEPPKLGVGIKMAVIPKELMPQVCHILNVLFQTQW